MPSHNRRPVRLYQSLMRDMEPIKDGAKDGAKGVTKRKQSQGGPAGPPDIWKQTYKALMRYTLAELADMAEREGVDMDMVIRRDSKGHVVNAIIAKRKERLGGRIG